jgi:hypothetical protein
VRSLFERTDLAQKQFVIAVDPRLAVITLRQLAEQYGIRESAPAFYAVFEDSAAGDFPVLLCPESLLGRGRCLDWVLVAHEIGHVVAEATQIVDAHYPSAPTDLKALRKWAAEGDQQSTSAMHLVEYACDEVGTRLGGAAFVWRLFTDVFSIDGMSRADTHPPIHKRIERAIATSRLLGFGDEASELEQMLRGEASGVDYGVITSDVPAEVLSQVTAQLERATRAITKSHVESACKLHSLALTLDLVRARLLAGIPTALDANTIFAATTLSEDIHNSEPLQEVVADSIRLGQMRVRFGEIMSAGHT